MIFRRFVVLSFVLCSSLTVFSAATPSETMLSKLADRLASYKSYQVDFTASMEDEFDNVKGHMVVSGPKYYVESNGFEIFCDGKLLYTYNSSQDEVTIERNNSSSLEPLSNPSRFFKLNPADFNSRIVERTAAKTTVELTPRAKTSGFALIRMAVNNATGLPQMIVYHAEGAKPVVIMISKLTPNVAVSATTFTFDRRKYPGVEVIDFR